MFQKTFSIVIFVCSLLLLVICFPFVFVWRVLKGKKLVPRDTSWEYGRQLLFKQGIKYWQDIISDFKIDVTGRKFLEVGSGNGQWLIALADMGAGGVCGVEPNKKVFEYGNSKISEYGKSNEITVKKASAEKLPFRDSSFDCVLCMGVFMFTNQKLALEEFKRVIVSGGQLMITVNGLGYFLMKLKDGIVFRQLREIRYGLGGFVCTLIKWNFGVHLRGASAVSVNEMKHFLSQHGFKLERVWLHNNIDLYPLEHFGFATNYAMRARKIAAQIE